MRPFVRSLLGLGVLVPAVLVLTPFASLGGETPAPAARQVSFLREVRPILAQHCFQCHGPDEAARKGKLRLDLKDHALAPRNGKPAVAAGDPDGSHVWRRVTTDTDKRMPPEGSTTLTQKEVATLRAWIEQGAKWEEHWSLVAPTRPAIPAVSNKAWVRDPLDAFVLARLDREGLRPEVEASRQAWLRRASFDLTGLPPTPAEIDAFVNDASADAYEKQVDRLLASTRYGERQAVEWLDLARYADTSGYQNDQPRKVWKWREWVINAYNSNQPFDQFTVEQLAGDLLPNPTLAQRIATGFNRNHPTNSEAGEEEDEYRSAYVIDRVNTTATVFMGLTMACAQCHDHKYDPISQKDYFSFYSFFNNIKERDADFAQPRPSLPVPNPDQEPRLADLKTRIATLQKRLDRDDPLTDAAQRQWERKNLPRVVKPVAWATPKPAALSARNGSVLELLPDGSVLASGLPPVKDTYDLMLRPGKKHIAAIKLELLPDDSQPLKAIGRANDGRFNLSSIEVRHTTLSDSQDPPPVYFSRADADINQRVKEEFDPFGMFPGPVASTIGSQVGGFGFGGGGWSIVGDERKKPHEAIFLPLDPLDTNDASVIRISLNQTGGTFKSLIGRFRLSYTEDDRVRDLLMPAQTKLWSSIGPFPAATTAETFSTVFDPEKDIKHEPLDLKKSYSKVPPPPPEAKTAPGAKGGPGEKLPAAKAGDQVEKAPPPKPKGEAATETKKGDEKPFTPIPPASDGDEPAKKAKDEAKKDKPKEKPKTEPINWVEQRQWRDGSQVQLSGTGAFYLTRKIVSTAPRAATVLLDGPAGFKVWVNGELVQTSAPPPPPAPPPTTPKKDTKPGDDEPPEQPEIDLEMLLGRVRSKTEKTFTIGLRQGENEIVVKAVFGGGGPPNPRFGGGAGFTFNLTPEGDDVLNHEVATALRLEAEEPAGGPVVAPAPRAVVVRPTTSLKDTATGVGEKTAAAKPEEDNPLTPSERRQKAIRDYYRSTVDPVGRLIAAEIAKLKDDERDLKRQMPETLVMEELATPRQAYIFVRGLYKNRGEDVDAGTPGVLPPMASDLPKNRLGLAKWLVSGQHPLTARVLVNRVWQQYFGIGLVRTAEDFGVRGELPTHPELLDYLATEFVAGGWDQKKLHKRIVLSATYRQASVIRNAEFGMRNEDIAAVAVGGGLALIPQSEFRTPHSRDPENRLFARGPRLRLTAEMVRDNALAVSGLLFEKVGGESVKPVQPKDATKGVDGFGGAYRRDRDEKQYRRGLYVFWKRGAPYPSMLNFDACKRDATTTTRAVTTTPLQALTLLNDPAFVECARMLGQRMQKDKEAVGRAKGLSKADEEAKRLAYGFRLCTSRSPSEREVEILKKLLDDQRAHFKADGAAAKKLLAVGDAKTDEALDPAEAAAWASVGSALLNLDATINR